MEKEKKKIEVTDRVVYPVVLGTLHIGETPTIMGGYMCELYQWACVGGINKVHPR